MSRDLHFMEKARDEAKEKIKEEIDEMASDSELPEKIVGQATEKAHETVTKKRNTHGDSYDNHLQIAELWSVFLKDKLHEDIEPWEVAVCMVLLKTSRMKMGELIEDHLVDVAGYADCGLDAAYRHPGTPIEMEDE